MSREEPPYQPSNIVDLVSENESASRQAFDLTVMDGLDSSSNASLEESNMDVVVDGQTLSITSGGDQKEGSVISPNNQPDSDSSDGEMTLSGVLAQSRKHKHSYDNTLVPTPKPYNPSLSLTKEALASFLGGRSLRPNANFWTIHKPVSTSPVLSQSQPKDDPHNKDGERTTKPSKRPNPYILNVDREEIFGPKDKSKHKKTSTQHSEPNNGHRPVRGAPEEMVSSQRHLTKTAISASTSKSNVEFEEQHNRKRPRLKGPENATTKEVPPASVNHYTNSNSSETDDVTKFHDYRNSTQLHTARRHISKSGNSRDAPAEGFQASGDITRPSTWDNATVEAPREYAPAGKALETASGTEHTDRRSIINGAKPPSSALDNTASTTSLAACKIRPGGPVPASHPSASQGRPRPSTSSTRGRRRPWDIARPASSISRQRPSGRSPSPASYRQPRRGSEEPIESTGEQWDGMKRLHGRSLVGDAERTSSQPKPSTIKLSTYPPRPEPRRAPAPMNETFEDAAASFSLLQSQYENKRTTQILDTVPADLGIPSPASRTQAAYRANTNPGRRPRQSARDNNKKRARYREKAVEEKRRKLEEEYADEPAQYREALVAEKLDEYRRKFAENDRKRGAQAQEYLTVDFLEDGAGADDADIDTPNGGNGAPARAARPKGAVPASQAMEPGETMVLYSVYISEPFDEGGEFGDHMQRVAEQFLKKNEANAFAQNLLIGTGPSSREFPDVAYKADTNGLLWGRKRLPDGKIVHCMVQKEAQVFGLLDMSGKWVREDVKHMYRPRFDVFYTNVIPKVFLDKEEEDNKIRKEQKAKETEAAKKPEGSEEQEEKGREESPEVWIWKGLDDGEGDNDNDNSLFSPTPTPEPEGAQDADENCSSQDGDLNDGDNDDDTASVASDATIKPSKPGGALGKMSWPDVEYQTIHAGSYTDLKLANEEAFKVARVMWKPRTARHYAWEHYTNAILPSLEEERKTRDLDVDRAEVDFVVPEVDGLVDHRPWLFVHSRVYVVESKLEGPREIGCDFVMDHGEG